MILRVGCVVALLLFSGCTSPSPQAPLPSDSKGGSRTLFFQQNLGLSETPPSHSDPGRIPQGSFLSRWGAFSGYTEFQGPPLSSSLRVVNPSWIQVFFEFEGPVVQLGTFPHVVAYFGTDKALLSDGSSTGPLFVNDTVLSYSIPLTLPPDGLVLVRGSAPRVLVVLVMTQEMGPEGHSSLLVNSTRTPSRVVLQTSEVSDPPTPTRESSYEIRGSLLGSAYARTAEGLSQRTHVVGIPPSAVRLDLELTSMNSLPFGDLDLFVEDGSGREIARSVTPYGFERVVLYDLSGLEVVHARVVSYGSVRSDYLLRVTYGLGE